jgi:hypothetical protein
LRHEDASRRENARREDARREDARRDVPRREDARRDVPRRGDGRRDDSRRDAPRRDDSRRDGRGGKRGGGQRGQYYDLWKLSKLEKTREYFGERPKWSPVAMSTVEIPVPLCPLCGEPIKELSMAFTNKNSSEAVHFDCARESVQRSVRLEAGDMVAYIGGGRFGVVHQPNAQNLNGVKIKQIVEWEKKEIRAEWRALIADHFSLT